MPRWVRIIAWIAVFSACAGIGAFIASRSNPFPPGVEDPGARPTESPAVTATATPEGVARLVTGTARTRHELFVGGSCVTDWTLQLHLTIDDAGDVAGSSGVARIRGRLRCDFPTAQAQAREIALSVRGHRRGDMLHLTLDPTTISPDGSSDFGGLVKTLDRFPSIPLGGDGGSVVSTVQVPDGDLGRYVATYRVAVKAAPGGA